MSQPPSFGPEVLGKHDIAVRELRDALMTVLMKHGAWFVMRVVASILAPYRRHLFEETYNVRESKTMNYFAIPATLKNKKVEVFPHLQLLEHAAIWRQKGEKGFFALTSNPYYASKEELRKLIAHCDEVGVDFQVDAESYYWPGHTIRIFFKAREIHRGDVTGQVDRWALNGGMEAL